MVILVEINIEGFFGNVKKGYYIWPKITEGNICPLAKDNRQFNKRKSLGKFPH